MYDWIIEADIVRLEKQLFDATHLPERLALQELLKAKRAQLRAAVRQGGYAPPRMRSAVATALNRG